MNPKKNILITGGAGYIGSHTVQRLNESGNDYHITVIDNLENGYLHNIPSNVDFYKIDLRNYEELSNAIKSIQPTSVVHFAGYAYVGESMNKPIEYFENNVLGGLNLLKALSANNGSNLVFSSSCSVYGKNAAEKINEKSITSPENPYAESKLIFEKMLNWTAASSKFRYVSLRYFNAAGAVYPLKEEHNPETHLIPNAIKSAFNPDIPLEIYGDNYETVDGTCIRDFVHVRDLAEAHLLAVQYLENGGSSEIVNLGTGFGTSVKEVARLIELETGRSIRIKQMAKRPGDVPSLIADPRKAEKVLNWKAEKSIKDVIKDAIESVK